MSYDKTIKSLFLNVAEIEYGVIEGNSTIVFIKVGQDGSIYGYENKYLTIASKLNKELGYTVIVASNPFDGNNPLDHDMNVLSNICNDLNIYDYKVYYMGQSNGARIGISWGYQYPKIKKMLLINSPIFINWHILKEGLKKSNNQEMYLVYGDKDSSYKYCEMLKPLLNDCIKLEIINGADHNFVGMIDEFINLPLKYFR